MLQMWTTDIITAIHFLIKKKIKPRYPFGYGLSYTSFAISDLHVGQPDVTTLDSIKVTVKVKNTGSKEGAEVVQLYIGFPDSKIDRPEKLLRGFRKVYLKPSEEKQVEFSIPTSELAYYNVSAKGWDIEKSKYEVLVGNSSSDDKLLRQTFAVR